jgi:outer membrane protein
MRALSPIYCWWNKKVGGNIMMKNLRNYFVVFLAAIVTVPAIAQEPQVIDLKGAISMALDKNEIYQIARKEVDRANAQIMEAISNALPQVTGNLTYLRNWEIPVATFELGGQTETFKFGTNHGYTADLTISQPLYSPRVGTALKIAKIAKNLARQTLRSSGQELKVQVFNGYYGALMAQDVYNVNQEALKLAQDNLDLVQKMYNQGMFAEYDLLRARVAVANLQPGVTKSRDDSELALNSFKNLLGLPLDANIKLAEDSDSSKFVLPPIDPVEGQKEVLANRPEVEMSDLNTMIQKKLISIYTAGYKPSLGFSTSLQYQTQFNNGNPFKSDWNRSIFTAVVLSVPIFDSWRTPSQVKQARIDYRQGLLKDQSVQKGMLLDFQQNLNRYIESRNRLSAQGDAVELARRGLAIANVRFESGVGTQLEVADARLSLSQAEINRAVAFHDLAVNYAALLRSLGREINP